MPFKIFDTLEVTIKNGVDLEAADFNGFSDPYVIVQTKALVDEKLPSYLKEAAKGWKQKTSIKKKDLNPTWNETKTFHSVYCLDKGEGIKVLFKVFDWDMLSRDDAIGKAEIVINFDKLEHNKEYSETLKLTDCKSGSLNITYKVVNFNQCRVESGYQYHNLFTPPVAELCAPKDFSLLSSSSVGVASVAIFANMKKGYVLLSTLTKLESGDLDFAAIAKNMSEDRFREMRKEYSKVDIKSRDENVNPDPHCKNKFITHILEFVLNVEKKGLKMIGTLRIVGHSNGYLGIYVYMEPQESLYSSGSGQTELARISESTIFLN
ncbi:hypothetical protein NAEGRDRAFT_82085 [Naegleria gruberi]|uniref:C2 domain-containing protein n=1 Tax=Naegleria gruberi TaxID=5762 RepID=D2W203_NAEGR|nr:uncharacterized protein NAEGRDRAFT_82085 [Naegleria gruberi]EFC36853.1 hypothetical protein NAEGRDRAFT_82085 [Naegleria gruberi]|eukprot:XP_002669597.1 hypothetical protein NAEGRDRAFT_82085 [Naegleria gruberi strain NEG-M]